MAKKAQIEKGMKVTKAKEKKLRKRPGGSNVGSYGNVSKGDFAGPAGGSPHGSFPVSNLRQAKSALKLAHNAPKPQGIKNFVYKRYPQLRPKKK